MYRPDDFNVGDWITIIETYGTKTVNSMFSGPVEIEVGSEYKGCPLNIKAINLPFIVAEFNYPTGTKLDFLDVRNYKFVKLNEQYVELMKFKGNENVV